MQFLSILARTLNECGSWSYLPLGLAGLGLAAGGLGVGAAYRKANPALARRGSWALGALGLLVCFLVSVLLGQLLIACAIGLRGSGSLSNPRAARSAALVALGFAAAALLAGIFARYKGLENLEMALLAVDPSERAKVLEAGQRESMSCVWIGTGSAVLVAIAGGFALVGAALAAERDTARSGG